MIKTATREEASGSLEKPEENERTAQSWLRIEKKNRSIDH
jgi:hypothetical protein